MTATVETPIEETITPAVSQSVMCEFCGATGSVEDEDTGELEPCPVCEGNPEIDYATVVHYALEIDDLRKQAMTLRQELASARKLRDQYWGWLMEATGVRTPQEMAARKPATQERADVLQVA